MAGGINPFGFTAGVIPAPRAPRQPQDLPSAPFGFAPPPSKMQQTWEFLRDDSNIGAPVRAYNRLMNTPLPVLLGMKGTEAQQEQAVADSFDAAGGLAMTGSLIRRPANSIGTASAVGKQKDEPFGFTVFHGSPHDFPPVRLIEMPDGTRLYQNMNELADTPQGAKILKEYPLGRFDMSKIGTGEGAQAYGHGLYFAEAEDVAKGYRDNNMGRGTIMSGKADNLPDRWQMAVFETLKKPAGEIRETAIAALRAKAPPEYADQINALLDNPGSMYEVRINADPDTFLDWDKPLSEQPEAVRRLAGWTPEAEAQYRSTQRSDTDALLAALEGDGNYTPAKMPRPSEAIVPFSASGDELHQKMFHQARKELGGEGGAGVYQARVAEKLREAGIPGIKYLDAGSRGAGDGTRNYVVFDDNLIEIVRKYGIAGASAMLGYNILDGMDPAQAEELKRIEGNQ